MELKEGGGVCIVSFSEVTPFEESVSTILSLIEAKKHGLVRNKNAQANRGGSSPNTGFWETDMGNLRLGKATFVFYTKIFLVQYAISHDMSFI